MKSGVGVVAALLLLLLLLPGLNAKGFISLLRKMYCISHDKYYGDLNGDGIVDQLCHDRKYNHFKFYFGKKEDETFEKKTRPDYSYYSNWCQNHIKLVISDVNRDGKDDIVCVKEGAWTVLYTALSPSASVIRKPGMTLMCYSSDDCLIGQLCKRNVCTKKFSRLHVCSNNEECVSGNCENRTCVYPTEALRTRTVEFEDKPGFFPDILNLCEMNKITDISWRWITVRGATLFDIQDRKAFGKLISRMQTYYKTINLYTPNVAAVLGDVLANGPQITKLARVVIFSDRLDVSYTTRNPTGLVNMIGHFSTKLKTESLAMKQFADNLASSYSGEIKELILVDVTPDILPNSAVLRSLFSMKIDKLRLNEHCRPSHLFKPLLKFDLQLKWKNLLLSSRQKKYDRITMNILGKNGYFSKKFRLWYGRLGLSMPWLPDKQTFHWSRFNYIYKKVPGRSLFGFDT